MDPTDTENALFIELSTGLVVIELFADVAPLHAERLLTLAEEGEYDDVAFHRVIDGFVAQTGDVEFGDLEDGYDPDLTGFGGSDLPDLPAEFSDINFGRGIVGMARANDPNSANSQFFIMFDEADFLNGSFTVVGQVIEGMQFVDQIKRGDGPNGEVTDPDRMVDVEVGTVDGFDGILGQGLTQDEAQAIALLYEAGLDRDGNIDLPGLNFWIGAREDGLNLNGLANAFLRSNEFNDSFGEPFDMEDPRYLDDAAFVTALYENVLERAPDEGGFAFWSAVLDQRDGDRAALLIAFAQSNENVEGSPAVASLDEVTPGEWDFLA